MRRRKPNPKEQEEQDQKTILRGNLNNSDDTSHVQEPSTARCMVLTTDHNGWRLTLNITTMISVTKTSNSAKSQPVCWLAQQNLKEKEKTKNEEERGT
jgi:hypothetical protein